MKSSVLNLIALFEKVKKHFVEGELNLESINLSDIIEVTKNELNIAKNMMSFTNLDRIYDAYNELTSMYAEPFSYEEVIILIDASLMGLNAVCVAMSQCGFDSNRLYTPTFLEKINDKYFIVDCWHNRVIYSSNLELELNNWNVLDDKLRHPHSVCRIKDFLLVEDTENNRICAYDVCSLKKVDEIFCYGRPHKIIANRRKDNSALCILSEAQSILEISVVGNSFEKRLIHIDDKMSYPYIRSIQYIEDNLWALAANGTILILDEYDYSVVDKFSVPKEYSGLNDAIVYGDNIWISTYTNARGAIAPAFLRYDSIKRLKECDGENVYNMTGFRGVPYYFSVIDGKLLVPEIDRYNRICSYAVNVEGKLIVDRILFDFGMPTVEDINFNNRTIK